MTKKHILFVVAFNLLIALGFYFENLGVGFSELSTDSQNAIPICYKIDNPNLFQDDLYLNDLDNVKYYTPFYIETIRFFSRLCKGDYIAGINLFSSILHFLYGILWFWGFYIYLKKDFWVSFLLSVIVRGVVWLPGYEIWGISDLWTIMPRTFYITFFPLPFIFLQRLERKAFLMACFLIGLIFNFHPITGIGGVLLFVGVVFAFLIFYKEYFKIKYLILGIVSMILGMFPFLLTYFTKTESVINYNLEDYALAFNARIPSFFTDITRYTLQWIKPKTLFYILPIVGVFILSFFKKEYKKILWIISIAFVFVMVFPVLSIVVEDFINEKFDKNLRMAFQLVRAQKTMIVLGLLALGLLLVEVSKKIKTRLKAVLVLFLVFLIGVSKLSVFDKVPFLSDDISRTVFPIFSEIFNKPEEKLKPIDKMADYIKSNTSQDALFADYFILRSAAKRSVIFDGKGASMLIEGNPVQFIDWYKDLMELRSKKTFNDSLDFFKNRGVDYLIFKTNRDFNELDFVHKEDNLFLFKIK